jgi:hypothetical protein
MNERPSGHQVPTGAEGGSVNSHSVPPREPSHAERCRTLVASARRGALSTIATEPAGYPYGSVASYGLDDLGNPLLFVSLMAEYTQKRCATPQASLLVADPVPEGTDPLASDRVTLLGDLLPVADDDRPVCAIAISPRTRRVVLHRSDWRLHLLALQSRASGTSVGTVAASWVDTASMRERRVGSSWTAAGSSST